MRWIARRTAFEASIYELNRKIRQLDLASIAAAETAAEVRKNSLATWILSPFYKQVAESEEEKARKDRGRQDREGSEGARITFAESAVKVKRKSKWNKAGKTSMLQILAMIRQYAQSGLNREARKWRKREEEEKEGLAKIRQQQQKQWAKEAEKARKTLRKRQVKAGARAAELARQEEYRRLQRRCSDFDNSRTRQSYASACSHRGWWDKVQHHIACPRCFDMWNYLLQCPGCGMKACPRCQSELRPTFRRHPERESRKEAPSPKSPSPCRYEYDDSIMY